MQVVQVKKNCIKVFIAKLDEQFGVVVKFTREMNTQVIALYFSPTRKKKCTRKKNKKVK